MDESNLEKNDAIPANRQSDKKVDESWKQSVEKEKELDKEKAGKPKQDFVPPAPDFKFFITTLALQASIAMGHIANPVTQKVEEDLIQAKFIIDTLGMLQEKTKGNLTPDEAGTLENLLYELRLAYVDREKGGLK